MYRSPAPIYYITPNFVKPTGRRSITFFAVPLVVQRGPLKLSAHKCAVPRLFMRRLITGPFVQRSGTLTCRLCRFTKELRKARSGAFYSHGINWLKLLLSQACLTFFEHHGNYLDSPIKGII